VVRQGHFTVVVVYFLIGCAVLLVVGSSGVGAEASQEEEKQGRTEDTKEQDHPGEAAPEEDRCDRTRTISRSGAGYLTNDVPGCPNKGGLLSSQLSEIDNKNRISDRQYGLLRGEKGDDEVRGLGGSDEIYGGVGSDAIYGGPGADFVVGNQDDDVIYGGDGDDYVLSGGAGEDVIYGGDGNDYIEESDDGRRDRLYCGEGRDEYNADTNDYVDSSCEKGQLWEDGKRVELIDSGGPPLILLAGAALLLGSGLVMSRYVMRRA
jgi:hemolysin type calcium-binding protein